MDHAPELHRSPAAAPPPAFNGALDDALHAPRPAGARGGYTAGGRPAPAWHVEPAAGVPGTALAAALDTLDWGVLIVDASLRVHHANRAARQRLRGCTVLALQQRSLEPARARDAEALRAAVRDAADRGLRTALVLQGLRLAVAPCDTEAAPGLAAVVLSRTQVCSALALQTLARQHGLTEAERSVLQALCQGRAPEEIARLHGVALCTVRTQVLGVRAKLGARSTRELLTLLAAVPPLAALVAD